MSDPDTNGAAASRMERHILADIALWGIPILLIAIFGFVWSINSKVVDLELRLVRLETIACMSTKAPAEPAPAPKRKTHYGEAQAAAPAETKP